MSKRTVKEEKTTQICELCNEPGTNLSGCEMCGCLFCRSCASDTNCDYCLECEEGEEEG